MESIVETLGLTARALSTVELDGRPAWCTSLSRTFPTQAGDLWDALTNPDRIPRWFLPIKGELRVGGSYQLEGNAGGTVEACDPPRSFRVTWVMGERPSWLTVTLRPEGPGTLLELEHVGHVPEEFWSRYGPSATGIGWDLSLYGLATHLATGADSDPARFAALLASPDGVAFVQGSAQAWQRVDVAAGARAARTVAFYTGQDESPQP